MSKKDLLLEIGTEEIPAGFMEPAFAELEKHSQRLFAQQRIEIDAIEVYGTPRRLTLLVKGVDSTQQDLTEEIRGPAKNIAFDENGDPTQAAQGFARGQGLSVDELEVRDTENGEYLFAVSTEEGQETAQLLPELLVKLIKALNFAQTMRWGDQEMQFVRPIRWLLAFYGEERIDFELAGVQSADYTIGHRFLSQGEIEIASIDDYFATLEEEQVIVDQQKRETMIVEQIKELEAEVEGEVLIQEDLLTEVNYLVEYPTALMGSFDQEFLELPREVLITSMREHQRYFPVIDEEGELKPRFITVRNGSADYIDKVREGNEKVLRARLADAKFFYAEDQQQDFAQRVEQLKGVIFQEDLGTIYEKVERMVELSEKFAQNLDLAQAEVESVKRAAYLSKADLVTEMVTEFPKLQGVMGREYAKLAGEKQAVAEAIFEHYLPRSADDELPASTAGKLVSIADKIDNIVGCFGVGLIPTGSQDPYALRRQAQGIAKIILTAELPLNLADLIDKALELLVNNDKLKRNADEVRSEVLNFFKQRMERIMEAEGIRYDVRAAVLATNFSDLNDTLLRAQALMEFRTQDQFENLITAYNRAGNLATKAQTEEINQELFVDAAEQELYTAYLDTKESLDSLVAQQDYVEAMSELVKLQPAIDNFFNSVMVMADKEEIKDNRLALLKKVVNIFMEVADLGQIVED
ncbi:glycine--tRNA ligase subunit beta [Fuchsiella alkaliacetigena]|uniref:glycine--tRNA ligase subunit beta n=1 Tax=Fuchsiella alkaliacetigena TaxID=957042 RepID=UPI00200AE7D8|nr:glycine--tRNA ligase subunit beta [Fuchsiella alkaliacetigena]MCK8824475.1 glycine--tRNA ligase subunit beta [Fuchsiella alkaliacetigena]